MLRRDIDAGPLNRFKAIASTHSRAEQMPAIYQRRVSRQQLDRRDLNVIAFTHGGALAAIRLIGADVRL
jgi:hypothetical protein